MLMGQRPSMFRSRVSPAPYKPEENIRLPPPTLLKLIGTNNITKAYSLLDSYAYVDEMDVNGNTPLLLLCHSNTPHIILHVINKLIAKGADVTHTNRWDQNSCHLLIKKGEYIRDETPMIITALLQQGLDINQTDSLAGETPLHMVMNCFSTTTNTNLLLQILNIFLEFGADPTIRSKRGVTSLHLILTSVPQKFRPGILTRLIGKEVITQNDITNELYSSKRVSKIFNTSSECCVCLANIANIILVPCGHVCICVVCNTGVSKCPYCCIKITNRILKIDTPITTDNCSLSIYSNGECRDRRPLCWTGETEGSDEYQSDRTEDWRDRNPSPGARTI